MEKFAQISGDRNPLHFDAAFAARTKFGRLVVQGGLTTGLLHALVAMDLPGPGTVFLSQNWKFTAPVYIGDTIIAEAEVVSVHASKPVTQLKVARIRLSALSCQLSARPSVLASTVSALRRGAGWRHFNTVASSPFVALRGACAVGCMRSTLRRRPGEILK